ncbi:hypothetical protein D3C86_1775190 [compost metagenome]
MNQRERSSTGLLDFSTPTPSNFMTIRPGRTLPPMLDRPAVGPVQLTMTVEVSLPTPGVPRRRR